MSGAGLYSIAGLHMRNESLAFEGHSIDAHVYQEFDPLLRSQGHRMTGCMERNDFPMARGDKQRIGGIDRKAISDHLLREHRIRNSFQRPNLAGQGRDDSDLCHTVPLSSKVKCPHAALFMMRIRHAHAFVCNTHG